MKFLKAIPIWRLSTNLNIFCDSVPRFDNISSFLVHFIIGLIPIFHNVSSNWQICNYESWISIFFSSVPVYNLVKQTLQCTHRPFFLNFARFFLYFMFLPLLTSLYYRTVKYTRKKKIEKKLRYSKFVILENYLQAM